MEVQVLTVPGEVVKDGKRIYYRDEDYSWFNFRLPNKSNSIGILEFPLDKYALGIGLTGWNWYHKKSEWVGFDFDSIIGHNNGLTENDLNELESRVKEVPWVTIYRSKGGYGLHFYVFLENPVHTEDHNEHAILARAILSNLSGLLNFNFEDKVDCIGQVLWIWHRETAPNGFELIKEGTKLDKVPSNWKDFENNKPKITKGFSNLAANVRTINVSEEHRKLLVYLSNQENQWWWDADNNILVTHTATLKEAHDKLQLKGKFKTNSSGKDLPNDINCFCFPDVNGSWIVYRFNKTSSEHETWATTKSGWKYTYFNRIPSFNYLARYHGGIRTSTGEWQFRKLQTVNLILIELGHELDSEYIEEAGNCYTKVKYINSEVIIHIDKKADDPFSLPDWAVLRGPPRYELIVKINSEDDIVELPDEEVRYVIENNAEVGWFLNNNGNWFSTNKSTVDTYFAGSGLTTNEIKKLMCLSVSNPWRVVTEPFKQEYPGDRTWNRKAPRVKYKNKPGLHPTWDKILNHLGTNCNPMDNDWCKENGIYTGYDYLLHWIACLFKFPRQPLPYLFFYSPEQDTGKSIFYESIDLLIENDGVVDAANALQSERNFNLIFKNAVLCYIEEINIGGNPTIYNKIKNLVTALHFNIHPKTYEEYKHPNSTHWVQVANDITYCPIFPGDTRITIIQVPELTEVIPKEKLISQLKNEAAAFTHKLFSLSIPETDGRLRIPALTSNDKLNMEEVNKSDVERFMEEVGERKPGYAVPFKPIYDAFTNTYPSMSAIAFGKELVRHGYLRGRYGNGGQIHIANFKTEQSVKISEGEINVRNGKIFTN